MLNPSSRPRLANGSKYGIYFFPTSGPWNMKLAEWLRGPTVKSLKDIKVEHTFQISPNMPKSVSFNQQVGVVRTFASEDYDRTSAQVEPMQPKDIAEFRTYVRQMRTFASVSQQLRGWKSETDKALLSRIGSQIGRGRRSSWIDHPAQQISAF